jgi:hypothetical protein
VQLQQILGHRHEKPVKTELNVVSVNRSVLPQAAMLHKKEGIGNQWKSALNLELRTDSKEGVITLLVFNKVESKNQTL